LSFFSIFFFQFFARAAGLSTFTSGRNFLCFSTVLCNFFDLSFRHFFAARRAFARSHRGEIFYVFRQSFAIFSISLFDTFLPRGGPLHVHIGAKFFMFVDSPLQFFRFFFSTLFCRAAGLSTFT